jgi:hypothetical protein
MSARAVQRVMTIQPPRRIHWLTPWTLILGRPKQLSKTPNVICQTRFHRGGHAKRLMRPAQVVPAHIKRNGMFQVLQLPAVSVGQASEAPKLTPKGQVASLNVRRADIPIFERG